MYDFETTQDTEIGENEWGSIYQHKVNCCVSWKFCHQCRNNPEAPCVNCGPDKIKEFVGLNAREEFCKYLFSPENVNCSALAHNSRGFDAQFILDYIHEQGLKPELMCRGLEIIELKCEGIRLIDSLNFLPMPLSAMSKAFELSECKGYFPHFFNRNENWEYEGDLPPIETYGPKHMKVKQRQEFEKWYNQEKKDMLETGRKFNLQKELVHYCHADVAVLVKACIKFREEFMSRTSVDPFVEATTIASACNVVFRKNYLQPSTIAIVPHQGYRKQEKQSIKAIRFMKWYAEKENLATSGQYIQHAKNNGEFRIDK